MSPMALSFYQDSRKCSNKKIKQFLNISDNGNGNDSNKSSDGFDGFWYPTYKEGVAGDVACAKTGPTGDSVDPPNSHLIRYP